MITTKKPFLSTPETWKKYKEYIKSAKQRGIAFDLNYFEFRYKIQAPCYICGQDKELNGIDRVDNTQHYHNMNTQPCCWTCNRAKSNMNVEQFVNWMSRFKKDTRSILTANLYADALSKGYTTQGDVFIGLVESIPDLKDDVLNLNFTNIRKCT